MLDLNPTSHIEYCLLTENSPLDRGISDNLVHERSSQQLRMARVDRRSQVWRERALE